MKLFPNIETHTTKVNKALSRRCKSLKAHTNGGMPVVYVRTLISTELVYPPDIVRVQTLTFKGFEDIPLPQSSLYEYQNAFVQGLLDAFGAQFLRMAQPIWKIKAEALRNAPITQFA
jgi:hypothetical protein